jgi:tungstate transport system permease protein
VGVIAAAWGRLIGEVGVSMMLGGNIAGYTRSLTTAIALETARGEFAFGIALGVILLVIAIGVNLLVQYLLKRRQGVERARTG